MATWGNQTWGFGTWDLLGDENVSLTGQALSASLGDETTQVDVSPDISGLPLTAALDTGTAIDIAVVTFPTGIAMSANLGQADAGPDAMLTTNHASVNLGTIDAYNQTGWSRQQWNVNAWGVEGQYATATPTGIAMNANIGTLTAVGTGGVILNTLNVAAATLGVVDPAPDAGVTGNFMIGATGQLGMQGDVPQDVTGIAMSAGLGSVVVVPGQEVPLTGLPGLARVASVTPIIHVDVLVTGNALTMAQGSGSALIWNEVNTGTAPIDPPGWQEVAA